MWDKEARMERVKETRVLKVHATKTPIFSFGFKFGEIICGLKEQQSIRATNKQHPLLFLSLSSSVSPSLRSETVTGTWTSEVSTQP